MKTTPNAAAIWNLLAAGPALSMADIVETLGGSDADWREWQRLLRAAAFCGSLKSTLVDGVILWSAK